MPGIVLGVLVAALGLAHAAHAGEGKGERPAGPSKAPAPLSLEPLDTQVRVPVPAGMTHERRSLGARADLMTLTDGGDVLVVVVYRASALGAPPTAAEALETHVAELASALGDGARRASQVKRLCGRERRGVRLDAELAGVARTAWVGAAEVKGRTIVASAVWSSGSANEALLERVTSGILVL